MQDQFKIRTHDMPSEMGLLLNEYPRDSWEQHPGFKEKTRHWLGAHRMFRRVSEHLRLQAEDFLDAKTSPQQYGGGLSYYGGALVNNLHGHHGWEDHSYFPELSAADPRFDAGLEVLEQDHADLDVVLDSFTNSANRVIQLLKQDEKQAFEEVGKLHTKTQTIETFLQRHLADEEELAVPIILHHRLRG